MGRSGKSDRLDLYRNTDFTNIKCANCGKGDLHSKNALRGYKTGNFPGKWLCESCYQKDYQKNNPNSGNNISKLNRDHRTGNLDPNSTSSKGDMFEDLTSVWRGVKRLSLEKDNYELHIDHTSDSELGIIQTKGRFYDEKYKYWNANLKNEHNAILNEFHFDTWIFYCASKDGKIIERIYIIPIKDIAIRKSITITKNPKNKYGDSIIPWYEKYRVTDEEVIRKVNEIWKDICAISIKKKAIRKIR